MRARGIGLALVALLLAAGCGSASSGSSTSGSAQTPTVSLVRAADVSTATAGYRSVMTLHETVPSVGGIDATANGTFSPAAHTGAMSMQMQLPPTAGLGTLQLQLVLTRSAIYLKLPPQLASRIPGAKPWIYINLNQVGKAAGIPGLGSLVSGTSSLSDPGQYLSFLRATSAGSVKDLGQATVNGQPTTHYHAEVDLAKLPAAVPAAERATVRQLVAALEKKGAATQMPIDAWIDSSHLIRRIQMAFSEPLGTTGQTAAIALTENFIQYGPQPAPAVPSASQTVNLLSLTQG
jgi:hypothetical protein